ncbi:uncharacterized protein LOC112046194 isoform X2 [Bicyclus anynana]|uniref:Uncharacterized protein LOC112046194 isoform X2 n=1 Tax=Bicyclus anynana TaxID=110368 RepID=A0A6J1N0F1_BICAN|nr:uncharacterized protein LOC112046194 isoform X2 [Bicyclus anynana]
MMKKRNILAQFNNLNNFFAEFEPFSTSPPAPEDSFFYIRYPKPDELFGKPKFAKDFQSGQQSELPYSVIKDNKDWSKHTKPCQDVLHGITPINTAVKSINLKPKPAGTDDGFKGEGAACGSSVVKVASQMISSTRSPRGFAVATPSEDSLEPPPRPPFARRGSKSLPATPAHSPPTSPTSRRKMNYNRYFTSPFEPVEDANSRSWLTMALLGFKKDMNASTSTLAEEDAIENRLHGTLAESVENLGPAPKAEVKVLSNESKSPQPKSFKASTSSILPKPSELREMNFWSPTSM